MYLVTAGFASACVTGRTAKAVRVAGASSRGKHSRRALVARQHWSSSGNHVLATLFCKRERIDMKICGGLAETSNNRPPRPQWVDTRIGRGRDRACGYRYVGQ